MKRPVKKFVKLMFETFQAKFQEKLHHFTVFIDILEKPNGSISVISSELLPAPRTSRFLLTFAYEYRAKDGIFIIIVNFSALRQTSIARKSPERSGKIFPRLVGRLLKEERGWAHQI